MDNQQESSRLINLGWLGGIIDGEGTITLRRKDRKAKTNPERIMMITPTISMVNTDKKIIDHYIEILKELEIPFWITKYEATDRWKARWKVEVTGIRRCEKALPHIIPYLVGKKELGELVYAWCKHRLEIIGEYYTSYDFEIFNKVKSFHGHQDEVRYIT